MKFVEPLIGFREIDAVGRVLRSKNLAYGKECQAFEKEFAEFIGVSDAIFTTSGTTALELALQAIDVRGKTVAVPSFTFNSSVSAILVAGGSPIFVDVDYDTYLADFSNEYADLYLPVHLYGQIVPHLAAHRPFAPFIVEDAAQAHGAEHLGFKAGAIGRVGCFSFYATKNMTTIEGGMVTTDDRDLADKIRVLRNHGQSSRYTHEVLSGNHMPTEIAGALGRVQLSRLSTFNRVRQENAKHYNSILRPPKVAPGNTHVYNQYTIKVRDRDTVTKLLQAEGLPYAVYYPIPVHKQPYLLDAASVRLPVTEQLSKEVLSLPVAPGTAPQTIERVAAIVKDFQI